MKPIQNTNYFIGFFALSILSLLFFVLPNMISHKCPVSLPDKHTTHFFCYQQKVPLNCIDEEYLIGVLQIVIQRKTAEKVYEYIRNYGIESIEELDSVEGVGPATLNKISNVFTVSKYCD